MSQGNGWALSRIRKNLADNPCTVPCLLFRERVIMTEHGSMSADRGKELLVLMDGGIQNEGFWYGHVLKVKGRNDEDYWVALVVHSGAAIDAPTVDLVFERYYHHMRKRTDYSPPYAQEEEDVFAVRDNFGDACLALAEMVRRFNPRVRLEKALDVPDSLEYAIPPGKPDLRSMDIYGMSCAWMDENGGFPFPPEYVYPDAEV